MAVDEVEKLRNFPSILLPRRNDKKPPSPTLKPLHADLKYLNLEDNVYPVIISAHLSDEEVGKLKEVLSNNRDAIVWTIDDIQGINH